VSTSQNTASAPPATRAGQAAVGRRARSRRLTAAQRRAELVLPHRMLIRYLAGLRRAMGWTQADVAARMHLTRWRVGELETNRYEPRLATLADYLTALDVTVRGFVVSDPRGGTVIVGTGPSRVLACVEGTPFPGRPGCVTGCCGHPVPEDEWSAGYRFCAGCQERAQTQERTDGDAEGNAGR
jgi:DNA-binding XRE family transcriptional regulator